MRDMIGFCGLDCAACNAYLATIHDDQALRERTAKLWAELNQAPILPEHIRCLGCRTEGVKTVFCEQMCAIRQCAQKRAVATCGSCPELETCATRRGRLGKQPGGPEKPAGSPITFPHRAGRGGGPLIPFWSARRSPASPRSLRDACSPLTRRTPPMFV